jgi:hypothetical protein
MIYLKTAAAIALIGCLAACAGGYDTSGGHGMPSVTSDNYATPVSIPMDPSRRIAAQDCGRTIESDRGNLHCR